MEKIEPSRRGLPTRRSVLCLALYEKYVLQYSAVIVHA